jgi:hypothetical protein
MFEVALRVEFALRLEDPLPDLTGVFAALRLALLAPPFDPVVELADAPDVEPAELLAEPDGPDDDDEEEEEEEECTAAFGGCGVTGVGRMESSATRSHSLRPDAL